MRLTLIAVGGLVFGLVNFPAPAADGAAPDAAAAIAPIVDDVWWEHGRLPVPQNHAVTARTLTYKSGDTEVTAWVFRPQTAGKFPAVLYQHGRRGLDELVQAQARRLAARGFVVVAPDIYGAHLLPPYPIEHDPALEATVNDAIAATLALPDISSRKLCIASLSRGGYYALKVAVKFKRQAQDVACYVSWYPHLQDPNAPEPAQVYGFAPEVEELTIPVLIFVGADEQYQRRRAIESAVKALADKGRAPQLIVYPGVGRGFDFRPRAVRGFADDLAAKDSMQRAAEFIQRHLPRK